MPIRRRFRCSALPILLTLAAALVALGAGPVSAQIVISGTITDDGTDQPIATVQVLAIAEAGDTVGATLSNAQGAFRLSIPGEGTFSLSIRRVGYQPLMAEALEVGAGDELQIAVRMDPQAVPLEAVTVVAQRRAEPIRITQFRERAEESRRLGRGRVYLRGDLDRMRSLSAGSLLEGVSWGGGRCRPVVLLNGLPADGILSSISADDLEGVEIYRGVTQIPPEYYRYGMCGLALFWTRTDLEGMRPMTWRRVAIGGAVLLLFGLLIR